MYEVRRWIEIRHANTKSNKKKTKIIDVGSADNLWYLHGQAAVSDLVFVQFLAQARRSFIRAFVCSLIKSLVY